MYLSRIRIKNFRNFSELDVALSGNVAVVGENRVGKTNLLYALKLIFDPTLPDSARQLSLSDFWDGLDSPEKIVVSVEIKDFESDLDVLSLLTDFRLDDDTETVRLTYEFRPRANLTGPPISDADFEFICFGGESETKGFGYDLRRRITMDLLPALRDAEGELAVWRRSPLRPLIEHAFNGVDPDDLDEIKNAIETATRRLGDFEAVEELAKSVSSLFAEFSGPKQDIQPGLGFGSTDITRLYRNISLLIDGGKRTISDASLGSANLVFLTLKILELKRLMDENQRDHTFLAIEEPEAHLHPHLQRSVYRRLFENEADVPLSVLLTTHSPNIASVAPLRSLVLLKSTEKGGSTGHSTAAISLTAREEEDLARYLDVTRAEMLFARGIILVEGDAEKFLVPVFAETLQRPLDYFGISVCSVGGTNFNPYAKLLTGLGIPFSIVTDWDPIDDKTPLGLARSRRLAATIQQASTGKPATDLLTQLDAAADKDYDDFCELCEGLGIFTNLSTLEVDLFNDPDCRGPVIETLREHRFAPERRAWLEAWESDPKNVNTSHFLSMVEAMAKGRFAQRLASRMEGIDPPAYIKRAIEFVADRV